MADDPDRPLLNGSARKKTTARKLDAAAVVKISDYLRNEWETITAAHPTKAALCRHVQDRFSLPSFTPPQLKNLMHACGLTWPTKHPAGVAAGSVDVTETLFKLIGDLATKLAESDHHIGELERRAARLEHQLDHWATLPCKGCGDAKRSADLLADRVDHLTDRVDALAGGVDDPAGAEARAAVKSLGL